MTAVTHGKKNINHLKQLVNEKELEWKQLSQQQVDSLAKELADTEEHLELERTRFKKLKQDFEYNLGLLNERDRELEEYERLFQQLKGNDVLMTSQFSEMKIKLDDLKKQNELTQCEKDELQKHYQTRLKTYQEEVNMFYFRKDNEVEKEKMTYENMKKELQNKIRELEEDSVFRHQRALHEFEEMNKEREEEYKQTLEDKDSEIHSYQLKLKMISREMDLLRSSTLQIEDSVEENKSKTIKLERALKQKDWELEDTKNMNNLKIQELENARDLLEKKMVDVQKEYSKKIQDGERQLNDRNQTIERLKDVYKDMEKSKHDEICQVKNAIEKLELKLQHVHWEKNDRIKDKDIKIKSLEANLNNASAKLKEMIEARSKESVAMQLEIEELRTSENEQKQEKERLRTELDRFKQDLKTSIERENILQQTKVTMEIEWRKRLETRENEIYRQHEELIKTLNSSKEEILKNLTLKEEEGKNQEHLIKILQTDRNRCIQVLQKHGLYSEDLLHEDLPTEGDGIDSHNDLREQNSKLKEVIKEMRIEMERLIQQSGINSINNSEIGSNKATENEIEELKTVNQELKKKLEIHTRDKKPPSGGSNKTNEFASPQIELHPHIKELNETICYLRNEKVQMSAFINSKDVKIRHLQKKLLEEENEKQELCLQIENMRYNFKSHDELESQAVRTLKERVSQLELQLEQSRSEAQAYFKGAIERNLDAVKVSKQMSHSKFTAQVRNLSDSVIADDQKEVEKLKDKLKTAVERIKTLTIERQKLINVGNRLRAELATFKEPSRDSTEGNIKTLTTKLQSKLDALEEHNYKETIVDIRNQGVTMRKQVEDIVVKLGSETEDTSTLIGGDESRVENEQLIENTASFDAHQFEMTSSGHSSLKEVWKLLEQDNISSHTNSVIAEKSNLSLENNFEIVGIPLTGSDRDKPTKLPSKTITQTRRKKKLVRNYNDKS